MFQTFCNEESCYGLSEVKQPSKTIQRPKPRFSRAEKNPRGGKNIHQRFETCGSLGVGRIIWNAAFVQNRLSVSKIHIFRGGDVGQLYPPSHKMNAKRRIEFFFQTSPSSQAKSKLIAPVLKSVSWIHGESNAEFSQILKLKIIEVLREFLNRVRWGNVNRLYKMFRSSNIGMKNGWNIENKKKMVKNGQESTKKG